MFRKLNQPDGSAKVVIYIDGEATEAEAGETVAAVLLRQRRLMSRTTPVQMSERAPYCMMGVCFDCLAEVDGQGSVQTCLVTVKDNMQVERQLGRRSVQK
ncbi:(2Fe-2S)-binding protein [Pantoea endophytica]